MATPIYMHNMKYVAWYTVASSFCSSGPSSANRLPWFVHDMWVMLSVTVGCSHTHCIHRVLQVTATSAKHEYCVLCAWRSVAFSSCGREFKHNCMATYLTRGVKRLSIHVVPSSSCPPSLLLCNAISLVLLAWRSLFPRLGGFLFSHWLCFVRIKLWLGRPTKGTNPGILFRIGWASLRPTTRSRPSTSPINKHEKINNTARLPSVLPIGFLGCNTEPARRG